MDMDIKEFREEWKKEKRWPPSDFRRMTTMYLIKF